jgi:acetyltransferase-like isoleucine patch superfamily enzyme
MRQNQVFEGIWNAYVRMTLRYYGIEWEGASPAVYERIPYFTIEGKMSIGSHCHFYGEPSRCSFFVGSRGVLKIGRRCGFGSGVRIFATRLVEIGDYSRCGSGVMILDSNFHETVPGDPVISKPVKIGRNVWLTDGCRVLRGSVIGDHSYFESGSVIKGEIPPKSFAAGIPAVVIRTFECADDWIRER